MQTQEQLYPSLNSQPSAPDEKHTMKNNISCQHCGKVYFFPWLRQVIQPQKIMAKLFSVATDLFLLHVLAKTYYSGLERYERWR